MFLVGAHNINGYSVQGRRHPYGSHLYSELLVRKLALCTLMKFQKVNSYIFLHFIPVEFKPNTGKLQDCKKGRHGLTLKPDVWNGIGSTTEVFRHFFISNYQCIQLFATVFNQLPNNLYILYLCFTYIYIDDLDVNYTFKITTLLLFYSLQPYGVSTGRQHCICNWEYLRVNFNCPSFLVFIC